MLLVNRSERHHTSTEKWQYSSVTTHQLWSDNIATPPHINSEVTIFQHHFISTVKRQYSSVTTHQQWSDNIPAPPHISSEVTIFQRHHTSTLKWQYSTTTSYKQWSDNIPASLHIHSEVTIFQRHHTSTVKWQYSSATTHPQWFMNFIHQAVAERWPCQLWSISELCNFQIWRPSHFLAGLSERWGLPSTSVSNNGRIKRSSRKSSCKNGTAIIVKYLQ